MFIGKVGTLCRAATQPPEGQNMITKAFVKISYTLQTKMIYLVPRRSVV